MKILNRVWGSVLLASMLVACSHSDSNQDATASSPQDTTQSAKATPTSVAKASQAAASSIQSTSATQKEDTTTLSKTDTATSEQLKAPVIIAQPVVPTSAAPTGPDRIQAMTTTGCSQRSCQ